MVFTVQRESTVLALKLLVMLSPYCTPMRCGAVLLVLLA